MQKSFPRTTTYYHVLQQNVVFASRTANLACRPSYSIFLLIYYFTFSLHARDAKKRFFISDGQPCMSALLFYCFTNLLLYYLLQIQYCRGRCLGLAARDAKKLSTYYHVLQQNVVFASRTANLACRPLFYYFTILLFHSRYSFAAADVWGWPEMQKSFPRTTTWLAVRDAKTLRRMFAVGRPKKFAADVCGWPSEMQKTLRPIFSHWRPRCKKLCGRCLRLAVRDAKNSDRKHRPQSFLHLGQPTANIGRRVFASRTANRKHRSQSFCISTANRKHRPQSFCISDGHSCMSAGFFACRPNASHC